MLKLRGCRDLRFPLLYQPHRNTSAYLSKFLCLLVKLLGCTYQLNVITKFINQPIRSSTLMATRKEEKTPNHSADHHPHIWDSIDTLPHHIDTQQCNISISALVKTRSDNHHTVRNTDSIEYVPSTQCTINDNIYATV
jgi:hypothetical protein